MFESLTRTPRSQVESAPQTAGEPDLLPEGNQPVETPAPLPPRAAQPPATADPPPAALPPATPASPTGQHRQGHELQDDLDDLDDEDFDDFDDDDFDDPDQLDDDDDDDGATDLLAHFPHPLPFPSLQQPQDATLPYSPRQLAAQLQQTEADAVQKSKAAFGRRNESQPTAAPTAAPAAAAPAAQADAVSTGGLLQGEQMSQILDLLPSALFGEVLGNRAGQGRFDVLSLHEHMNEYCQSCGIDPGNPLEQHLGEISLFYRHSILFVASVFPQRSHPADMLLVANAMGRLTSEYLRVTNTLQSRLDRRSRATRKAARSRPAPAAENAHDSAPAPENSPRDHVSSEEKSPPRRRRSKKS